MPEKPNLHEEKIITLLQVEYDLKDVSITFLPLGHDPNAWVYKVQTDSVSYFLKVKKGDVYELSVDIPSFLLETGFEEVVAPIKTRKGSLWTTMAEFFFILYPYIDGKTGMTTGLSNDQWRLFGSTLKRLHAIQLPDRYSKAIVSESFTPKWGEMAKDLHLAVKDASYTDPVRQELASFWEDHFDEIGQILSRTEALGREAKLRCSNFVLCHTDIHTDNILFDDRGRLFIIDWDDPMLAPKERDLMFFVGKEGEKLFFEGYGNVDVDPVAIAYYRYEWVVQEIGEYGELVMLASDIGDETKKEAVQSFKDLFTAGNVVEFAYRMDRKVNE